MTTGTGSVPDATIGSAATSRPGADVEPSHARGLLAFTLIAYGITWSVLIGAYLALRAGSIAQDAPIAGLLAQLAATAPLIAAVLVVGATSGRPGLRALGLSILRWRVGLRWYLLVLLGVPLLVLTAFSLLHPAELLPALAAQWPTVVTRFPPYLVGIALVTGLAEEPGWRGFALARANARFTPLTAALLVSVVWALWHLPNVLFNTGGIETALAHVLATTVNGVVLAWVFNSTGGSVFIVMLLHGAVNATAGLVMQLLDATPAEVSLLRYYLVSAATFGCVVLIVTIATKGRLGARGPGASPGTGVA